MTLGTIIHERRFQAGFDAGNFTLVDIGFLGFALGGFEIEIVEPLAINKCDTQFFRLRGVKQHSFHFKTLRYGARPRSSLTGGIDQTGSLEHDLAVSVCAAVLRPAMLLGSAHHV